MSNGIVIIGSGFAARQLVKNIRKQDATIPLTLIAADSIDITAETGAAENNTGDNSDSQKENDG